MPHNWLNAPRLFNRLIHPNVSFSKRELAVWGTASSQSVLAPTLGRFCRTDVAADRALSRDESNQRRSGNRPQESNFQGSGITNWVAIMGFEARRGTEDIAGNCHQAAGHWHLSKAESEDDGKHREGRHHGPRPIAGWPVRKRRLSR